VLLRGVNGPCIASGPYSCRYTDAHRVFRCLSGGSSDALLTTFQSRSNLVKLTPVITPTFFSPYHRTFRCLGLAGPLVLFPLNSFRGPTRQSHSLFFFLHAKPPPSHTPVRLSAAATPAPPLCCRTRAAPAPLRRRATNLAPVHRLSRAPEPRSRRPAPHLRRLCAADPAPPPVKPARLLRAPCILL
jgi:hypothetical protein